MRTRARGSSDTVLEELVTRLCTTFELGIATPEEIALELGIVSPEDTQDDENEAAAIDLAKFYPFQLQDQKVILTKYQQQMRCFENPVSLQSNAEETNEFQQIFIKFEYCDNANRSEDQKTCCTRPEAEYEMIGKTVMILSN